MFGWEPANEPLISLDAYMCKVLDTYYQRMLLMARQDANTLLLNYNLGPLPILEQFCAFTGTRLPASLLEEAYTRSRYHGKYPGALFTPYLPLQNPPPFLQAALESYAQLVTIA
ncbi:hypothetical protein GA0116948_10710 [Chitinophaga costaii]|uniref:Uncharacterized protein n=1 Tax=Chitinophaga costaii TaxID=1335309 RepID=A0A1C4E0P8_9BACT|nr:hypothetical protein [Chitinophaga costaii]SCC37085.1 hypothetical protein GA0116948_10710 [Chitinophaga costaii]